MPIDQTPSKVATSALQAIPFSSLIGGPLDACIKAQALAAKTSWEFIQNVGLNTDPETNERKAINVTFQYQKGGQMVNLVVPLLTIVPIPYIAIDEISIDFKANISAASSSVAEESSSSHLETGGDVKIKAGWGPFSVEANFHANYSSKKDSKASEESKYSVEYTMDVHVGATQASMPAGLGAVLNILQSSITESNPSGMIALSPDNIKLDGDESETIARVEAEVKDGQGLLIEGQNVNFKLPSLSVQKVADDGSITPYDLQLSYLDSAGAPQAITADQDIVLPTDENGVAVLSVQFTNTDAATGTRGIKPSRLKIEAASDIKEGNKTVTKKQKAVLEVAPNTGS